METYNCMPNQRLYGMQYEREDSTNHYLLACVRNDFQSLFSLHKKEHKAGMVKYDWQVQGSKSALYQSIKKKLKTWYFKVLNNVEQ